MEDIEKLLFIILGVVIGGLIAWGWWHPNNNDYVSQTDYNLLRQQYFDLQQKYGDLKEDTASLVLEYYGKNTALTFFGLQKHKILICVLQEHLIGEIPLVKEIC